MPFPDNQLCAHVVRCPASDASIPVPKPTNPFSREVIGRVSGDFLALRALLIHLSLRRGSSGCRFVGRPKAGLRQTLRGWGADGEGQLLGGFE